MKFASFLLAILTATTTISAAQTVPAKVRLPDYRTTNLDNGVTLFLMERHDLPLVSFHWILPSAGGLSDPEGKQGLAMLTAQMLRKGTASRSAGQIAEAVDFVGGVLECGAGQQFATGSAEFVKKDTAIGLDLVVETLLKPSFPEEELQKMIQQEIDGIKQAKEIPGEVISIYYNKALYGSHPYGRPTGGTEVSLASIERKDVVDFYAKKYAPNQLALAVVGDFVTGEMEQALKSKLGNWNQPPVSTPVFSAPQPVVGRKALLVEKPDATQVFVRVGNLGLARTNADWIPVQVVNTLFGGRFTSMLNSELRIQSGLTYHANTYFDARPLPGSFAMYFYSGNDTGMRAVKMALDVLSRLHDKGITPEQLQSAKEYIKGQFGPTLQTNDELADILCDLHFYGLKPDYINTYLDKVDAMTLNDARRVIEKHFPVRDLQFVIVGTERVIAPIGAAVANEVTRKAITDPGF